MSKANAELVIIIEKFSASGWDLLDAPAQNWLASPDSPAATAALIAAVAQADAECGSCGCEFDPLYKRALDLLKTA